MGLFLLPTHKLSEDQLRGFKEYKYCSIDTNPIGTYVMHPFWDWLVKYIPIWLAPNLITFVGFLFIIKSFLLLSYYDYYFYASSLSLEHPPIPRWVFAVVAINIFVSYTLDGLDGKQARRTKTSGPLGELFDHGLDSWTTVFVPLFLYSVFGRLDYTISPFRMYLICWNVFFNFYITHVEKYNTGVLYLPWSYDFSMLFMVLVCGLTSAFGHEMWKFKIGRYALSVYFEVSFYIIPCVFNIPLVLHNLYAARRNGTDRKLPVNEGIRPVLPFLQFAALMALWIRVTRTRVLDRDPRAFCLLTGTVFSNICCELIVAQMSNTRCSATNRLLLPIAVCVLTCYLVPTIELVVVYAMLLLALYYHIRFGYFVVRQMCDHFGIHCFYIRPRVE